MENKSGSFVIELTLTLITNACILKLATYIFKGFVIKSFLSALIAAFIILILNKTIKPILKVITLPITILSLGLLYPLTNVLILKLVSLLMGQNFILTGWFIPFFISIFISISTIFLEIIISKIFRRSMIV